MLSGDNRRREAVTIACQRVACAGCSAPLCTSPTNQQSMHHGASIMGQAMRASGLFCSPIIVVSNTALDDR